MAARRRVEAIAAAGPLGEDRAPSVYHNSRGAKHRVEPDPATMAGRCGAETAVSRRGQETGLLEVWRAGGRLRADRGEGVRFGKARAPRGRGPDNLIRP